MRILNLQEINEALAENDNEYLWLTGVLTAQDAKTRKDILQEVVKWLRKHRTATQGYYITDTELETLERGEMP